MVIKRGRVLRDTNVGPGLVTVDGKQYSFNLEDMWVSEVPPRPGVVVDVTFSDQGLPVSLQVVPENQIAREQAHQALSGARTQGTALASTLKARFGVPLLFAAACLFVGWFFLGCVSIGGVRLGLTFWQLLAYVGNAQALMGSFESAQAPGPGIYGLLAFAALAGPFVRFFWQDWRAAFGGFLPLLLMLLVSFEVQSGIEHALDVIVGTGPQSGPARAHAMSTFLSQFSLGVGAYVSLAACVYFAGIAARQLLVNRAMASPRAQQVRTTA
jgi:hypothetical protein